MPMLCIVLLLHDTCRCHMMGMHKGAQLALAPGWQFVCSGRKHCSDTSALEGYPPCKKDQQMSAQHNLCRMSARLERAQDSNVIRLVFTGGGSGVGGGGLGSRGGGSGGGGDDGFSGRGGEGDYEASLRASGKSLDSLPAGNDHAWF